MIVVVSVDKGVMFIFKGFYDDKSLFMEDVDIYMFSCLWKVKFVFDGVYIFVWCKEVVGLIDGFIFVGFVLCYGFGSEGFYK